MRFAVISDLHFPSRQSRAAAFVKAAAADATIDFVVTPGDLTDSEDERATRASCWWCMGCMGCMGCLEPFEYGDAEEQLRAYAEHFDAPLHRVGKQVYAVPGNHDAGVPGSRFPVVEFVRSRHGGTNYLVYRGGIALAFCGVYPDGAARAWLAQELIANPALTSTPFAFFFHYNMQDAMSDWWSPADKDAFRVAIQKLNVVGIFVGHNHVTYSHTWHGHAVHCTGGDDFWVMVDIDDKPSMTVSFVPFTQSSE